ncbi:MAG TPA: transglutaminase domain-containing protein, partial [Dyadobacter sp.]|nr:transglutaminase domain-containing protein [Dyadobacter sp.]
MNPSRHIRKFLYASLLLVFPLVSSSQTAELDSILRIIENQPDRIRLIFDYVADEIQYDTDKAQMLRPNYQLHWSSKSVVLETIKRRKGVCEHYAELFNELLRRAGYESYTVSGYTKGPTKIEEKVSHAWNSLKTSKGWYLYDPTWSSGTVDGNFQFVKDLNDTWYKVPPEEFILTHIPFDPIWQLLNPPLSNHQIKANDFSQGKSNNYS